MQNTDWWSQMILLNSLENVMIPASELAINISLKLMPYEIFLQEIWHCYHSKKGKKRVRKKAI